MGRLIAEQLKKRRIFSSANELFRPSQGRQLHQSE
jgi:hypothetical protein